MPDQLRVVIADDHPGVLTALRRILEPHCEVVAVAADGEALIRSVANSLPDVVVADIYMPGMNGLDACRHIRLVYPSVSVIIISGQLDDDVIQHALELGASAVLHKHRMAHELPAALLALV